MQMSLRTLWTAVVNRALDLARKVGPRLSRLLNGRDAPVGPGSPSDPAAIDEVSPPRHPQSLPSGPAATPGQHEVAPSEISQIVYGRDRGFFLRIDGDEAAYTFRHVGLFVGRHPVFSEIVDGEPNFYNSYILDPHDNGNPRRIESGEVLEGRRGDTYKLAPQSGIPNITAMGGPRRAGRDGSQPARQERSQSLQRRFTDVKPEGYRPDTPEPGRRSPRPGRGPLR